MEFLELIKKNKEAAPKAWNKLYETEIENLVRQRYSVSAELAILRQRDSKPDEFAAYNNYVEQCKKQVKAEMGVSE